MAICNQCGHKYRMNWTRTQPCPLCRNKPKEGTEVIIIDDPAVEIELTPEQRQKVLDWYNRTRRLFDVLFDDDRRRRRP